MPKLCPNITFPHQQDFFPIRSVTKSLTARFLHENLVEKIKIFVQDFVPIRTALTIMFPFSMASLLQSGIPSPSICISVLITFYHLLLLMFLHRDECTCPVLSLTLFEFPLCCLP